MKLHADRQKGQKANVRALYTEKQNKQNQTRLNLVCEKHTDKRSRTKSFEVKSEQIQQLLSEEELGGRLPPPLFKPGTHAIVANAGLRLRGL